MFSFVTTNILVLSLVSLFNDMASEMLFPITPIFLASLGYGAFFIGLLEGFAELTAGMSKGYFGELSDRLENRKSFVQIGYGLSAVSKPILGLIDKSIIGLFYVSPLIFLARFADRLGKGIRTNARDAWLADESTTRTRGAVFGFHRALDTTGAVLGPLISLTFLKFFPGEYRKLFLLAFLPGLATIGITRLAKEKRNAKPVNTKQLFKSNGLGFFKFLSYWGRAPKSFKRVCGLLCIFAFINSSDALLLLFAKNRLGSDEGIIIGYVFYNLVYSLLALPLGHLADRMGMSKTLSFGLVFFGATYGLLTQISSLTQLFGVFFLYAVYAASTESISKAWLTKLVASKDKATALGLFTAFQSVGIMLASSWTGLLWMKSNPTLPFLISAAVAVLVGLALLLHGDGESAIST